ncbi:MAG: hypothetical protein C0467_21790 [Planctomycetaceae bacterium]|nr:hypothetical protein [Planctomycetaceae bacterium]
MARFLATAIFISSTAGLNAQAVEPSASDNLARLISNDFKSLDNRRRELIAKPVLPRAPLANCPALGYHSRPTHSPNSVRWVQVDLGERCPIDTVVVVPAAGPPGEANPGYFFPRKLRVELSDHADLTDAVIAAEFKLSGSDGLIIAQTTGRSARFIRITATELSARGSIHYFVVGEVLVLSGNRNLASGRPVTGSESIENPPVWGLRNLVDGQGIIGPPIDSTPSPTNGYHADISESPNSMKWVQVDLGSLQHLEEVRLVPARPNDFAERSGFGFPVRFKVEAATECDFHTPQTLLDSSLSDYPNPGDGLVVIPTPGTPARFVRVTATRLWERTGDYVFALAELQVYSEGKNVARNVPVTALDSIENRRWGRQYLVDGFASQNQLIEWPEWVEHEQRTAEWEANWRAVGASWEAARARADLLMVQTAAGIGVGVLVFVVVLIWRGRVHRRRETEQLRDRIARDLHDEVGSNLGGILLLAHAGGVADLPEIGRIAQRTAESLRDLVWLMGRGPDTSADLLAKLRESAAGLLHGVAFTFDAPESCLPGRVSLEFKRQLFLAFKEILHNVVRHAAAKSVAVRCHRTGNRFILEVHDDGKGFDQEKVTAGTGLRGLLFRATTLGGQLEVTSKPRAGTTVRLDVPVRF